MLIHRFLFIFSIASLLLAYISQYKFDLEPCILCLYQRIPYFAVILLSFISFFVKGFPKLILIILCGISFLVGGAIATYHVGVETGKLKMTSGCLDNGEPASTIEEMTKSILGAPTKPCNEVAITFLGVSMAGWNMILSLFIGIITLSSTSKVLKNYYHINKSEKYNKVNK